ncbi:MAG: ChaN family lipoprotein [Deltaproteobacteria bacterium]|nr:ChaN family lipoprotein [Deltaproteobacteria bacterium]
MVASPSRFQASALALQRALFEANHRRINAAVEGYTEAFRRYERTYRRTVRTAAGPAPFEALIRATQEAQVVLVGDYHTLRQSQRAFFRLLRRQPVRDVDVVVALEMLPADRQADVERFLAGRIHEATFERRVKWRERWPFGSPTDFEPIFRLARTRGWRVMGVDLPEPGHGLGARDEFAAERIVELLAAHPNARVFCLMGDMHLAPAHLPRALQRAAKKRKLGWQPAPGSVLRVHQNPDQIWFEQAAAGVVDEHDAVALPDGAYALLTASPVVCQQSFLTWLDQVYDGDVEGPHGVEPEAGHRLFSEAVRVLGRALRLPARAALADVRVVGPADLSFFERLVEGGLFTRQELRGIRAHILASESYYIPRARLVYLATLSVNHTAEEASHFLRHHCSKEGIDEPRGLVDAFYCRVLNEAIGFMGSKIVNPKRKGVDLEELAALAGPDPERAPPPPSPLRTHPEPRATSTAGHGPALVGEVDATVARYALAHKRMEQGQRVPWLNQVFHGSPGLFNAVTHVLGYLLGERLYYGLVRGVLSDKEARDLYFEPFEEEGAALLKYFELAARVGMLSVPKRG